METVENQIKKKQTIKRMRSVFSHIGLSLFAFDAVTIMLSVGAMFLVSLGMKIFGYSELIDKVIGSTEFQWISTAVFQFFIATVIFLALIRLKKPIMEFDKTKKRFSLKQTVLVGIVCIAIMQLGSYISNIMSMAVDAVRGAPLESVLDELIMESDIFLVIIVCVIIGPIVEEVIFRKCVIDRLRPFGEGFAVVCSAIIFAIAHGNFLQVFYSFGLGALLAIIYLKTNNLNICIGYHVFVNFTGSVIPLLFLKSGAQESLEVLQFNPALVASFIYMVLLFFITAAGILIMIITYKHIKLEKCKIEGITLFDRIKAFVFNPGMILVFLTAVCNFILSF